jgi:DNA-binding NtrC family response regulator
MTQIVLIVDDEPDIREILVDFFSREPYRVLSGGSAREALQILDREPVDVVICDEKMPGMQGSELLSIVRKKFPDTIRIILTGHASLEAAIRAINEGEIYRFFTKPCNLVDLAVTVRQALKHKALMKESQRLLRATRRQSAFIEDLEKRYPGITEVKRNEGGAIVIDENLDDQACDNLIDQISETVKECEDYFRGDS